ncbi:hypothetical protein [Pseudalkalibacillus sp. SCS-8]|uniref:hypothetical protein n=1 Tax=Pseudalkalibacillus nanhaiensis TaxID=3115291 RepID=UPI0032D9B823
MTAGFLAYFIIYFIVARLISFSSYISWMPTKRTSWIHDVIIAAVFAFISLLLLG